MTERKDCIDEILKALKDRRDRKFVQDRLEELDERVQADGAADSMRDKYFRAAKELLEENAERSAQARREIRLQALAFRDLRNFVDAGVKAGLTHHEAITAAVSGVNRPVYDAVSGRGQRLSAEAVSLAAQKHWIGGAIEDLERIGMTDPAFAGIDKLFLSRAIEDDIFREKIELERAAKGQVATPGLTKNAAALKIAETLQKWDRVKITALNDKGGFITEHASWGARVIHDPDRLLAAAGASFKRLTTREANAAGMKEVWDQARAAWVAFTLQRIDAKAMFGTTVDADKKLAEMWGGLVTGDHMKMTTTAEEPFFLDVAQKVSRSREFVWKSADAQLEYMRQFGRFTPTEGWLAGMRDSANKYGLMSVFGPVPEKNFEEIIAYAKSRMTGDPAKRLFEKKENGLRNRYDIVSGKADIPVANITNGLVNETLRVQRMAKLGFSTVFAMMMDNTTISLELAYQGMGFWARHAPLFSDYFRGAPTSEKREVARLLHAGVLDMVRSATARFDAPFDARAGFMSWLENKFFTVSLIAPMTRNKRTGAERMMALHMGGQRGKDFSALGAAETRILQAFGIAEKEWALLNKAEWTTIDGSTYLTPDVVERISDADMRAYAGEGLSISERAAAALQDPPVLGGGAAPRMSDPLQRARSELAMKLWAYYGDRGQFAVIEPGANERAIMQGWGGRGAVQTGTPLNNALRILTQFKTFPVTMMTKVWGREIYGGKDAMGKVSGIVELMVMGTLLGTLANVLSQYAKGQDPLKQIQNDPLKYLIAGFMRGGAGSIYGDFLLGEFSRHGLTAADNILGPTFGQINSLATLWSDLTHTKANKATGALALRTIRTNTPMANMIWTKMAVDYLFFYRLQEWINPGYLQRYEALMKRNAGIEFWLKPSQVSR